MHLSQWAPAPNGWRCGIQAALQGGERKGALAQVVCWGRGARGWGLSGTLSGTQDPQRAAPGRKPLRPSPWWVQPSDPRGWYSACRILLQGRARASPCSGHPEAHSSSHVTPLEKPICLSAPRGAASLSLPPFHHLLRISPLSLSHLDLQ